MRKKYHLEEKYYVSWLSYFVEIKKMQTTQLQPFMIYWDLENYYQSYLDLINVWLPWLNVHYFELRVSIQVITTVVQFLLKNVC